MSFDNIISSLVLQLGTVHLCRSVIRSIETARIFDFEEFPIRDKVRLLIFYIFKKKKLMPWVWRVYMISNICTMLSQVTYMYYTGRLEVFNENFPSVSNLISLSLCVFNLSMMTLLCCCCTKLKLTSVNSNLEREYACSLWVLISLRVITSLVSIISKK